MASSLNFEYLEYFSLAAGQSSNRGPLSELILKSRARSWLEEAGYQTYISGEYLFSEVKDPALVFRDSDTSRLTTFESLLLESTIFEILVDLGEVNISTYTYQTHRQKILNGFAELEYLVNAETPKFVFSHIIAPHPPFVFDQNGNPIQPDWEYTIFDTIDVTGGYEAYIEGYRGQLIHINRLTLETIDQIIDNSSSPPIIIIQADHGPATLFDDERGTGCLSERFSILNAYYFADNKDDILYKSITPVNTFRVIFDTYFGTHLGLLPDLNYFSAASDLYRFIDVTQKSDDCIIP